MVCRSMVKDVGEKVKGVGDGGEGGDGDYGGHLDKDFRLAESLEAWARAGPPISPAGGRHHSAISCLKEGECEIMSRLVIKECWLAAPPVQCQHCGGWDQ